MLVDRPNKKREQMKNTAKDNSEQFFCVFETDSTSKVSQLKPQQNTITKKKNSK